MNRGIQVAGAFFALFASLAANGQTPLGEQGARALLTRATFAPSQAEVERIAPLTQAQAVERLLASGGVSAARPAPAWINERVLAPRELRALSDEQRMAEQRENVRRSVELRAWWLQEMAATDSPLAERMTLFWHNHFVSAQPKVRAPQLMYRQNVLLRRHALGNFRELLHAASKSPAMLVYLDSLNNRKGAPNENFAREVMELFTLGEGNYAEADIKEAARAFTGWSLDLQKQDFVFRRALHDDGEKSVLGVRGKFDGDAVLDVLLTQPAAARFIVTKLWREFVSPTPDPARVEAIAAAFRAGNYEIKVVLREILLQPELVSRTAENALIKSPVELVIGFMRQSGAQFASPAAFAIQVAGMGQNVFSPPNVRGWPGGEAWINTQTLLARKQFLERVVVASTQPESTNRMAMAPPPAENRAPGGALAPTADPGAQLVRQLAGAVPARIDADAWLKSAQLHAERMVDESGRARLERSLLVVPAVGTARADALGLDALRTVLLDPAYQMK